MDRIKKVFVVIHLVLWMLLTFLVAFQLSEDEPYWLRVTIGFIGTALYVFYRHFFLLLRYATKGKKRGYFSRLLVIILTGPFPFLFLRYAKTDAFNPDLLVASYSMLFISVVPLFIFLSWLARVTENLVLNTVKKEQLEKQAVEAQLYYLKSQINPHFLFNTLNNIHTLVYKQAPSAPDAVMQLASLMRYMIYESNAPLVPLKREMDYLQDYVSLQQLRYKQGPVLDLQIKGDTGACQIAPLLFIHLLENTYKHSPARLDTGDLKVSVEVKEDLLIFQAQNPVGKNPTNSIDEPGGIGLPNLRKRLALLYPGRHILEIHHTAETFSIILKINGVQMQSNELMKTSRNYQPAIMNQGFEYFPWNTMNHDL